MNTASWILIGITVLVTVSDIVFATHAVSTTYSQTLLRFMGRHPLIIPFAFGVLCGHLFWPQVLE